MKTLSRMVTGRMAFVTWRSLPVGAALLLLIAVALQRSAVASPSFDDENNYDSDDIAHSFYEEREGDGRDDDSDNDGFSDTEEIREASDPYDHDSIPLNVFTEMVEVSGGVLPATSEFAGQIVKEFYIGKYEVIWAEWRAVRDWAVANGYTYMEKVGEGSGDDHPVRNVSCYDVLKWCNALSEKEGLIPVYMAGGDVYRTGETMPVINTRANGYRLPTIAEWEWAGRGGARSNGRSFSGSDDLMAVGWNHQNSGNAPIALGEGRGTWPVGMKAPNELGIYDMSGNVAEWCFDGNNTPDKQVLGGSWSDAA